MKEPTTEEISDVYFVREEWRKRTDGIVVVKRWLNARYLGEVETPYQEIPFVKMCSLVQSGE